MRLETATVADGYLTLLERHHAAVAGGLAAASASARAVFAASCAEVLYPLWPLYCEEARLSDDSGRLRAALNACWEWTKSRSDSGVDPAELADEVADLAPRTDESRSKLAPWAQNAALATAAALDAWAGAGLDRVVAASDRVVESLDYVVDDPPNAGDLAVIELELERQRRALGGDVESVRAEAEVFDVAAFIRRRWNR
jgi:hypothetical protein